MKEFKISEIFVEEKVSQVKVGEKVKIKDGCQLKNVVIGENTVIGRNVTMYGSEEKPVIIGSNCYIPYGCLFSGGGNVQIRILNNVIFSPFCEILVGSGPYSPTSQSELIKVFPAVKSDVEIGNNCWIMTRSTILPGVKLGNNVAVAAHSLVKGIFGENLLIGGIPARIIRKLDL